MAGSSKDIIDSLIAKFHAMSDLCKASRTKTDILKDAVDASETRDASFAK